MSLFHIHPTIVSPSTQRKTEKPRKLANCNQGRITLCVINRKCVVCKQWGKRGSEWLLIQSGKLCGEGRNREKDKEGGERKIWGSYWQEGVVWGGGEVWGGESYGEGQAWNFQTNKQTQVSNNQRLISDVIIERLANVLVLGSKLI